ncbi:GntR family transcriptional regulator [Novosphingobium sp. BW1]|uniref:GntR family transcriptional regulator n=1 Tax=Novosphingobium sp. BW1 TaxID=2592621 RepID=UPI0011DEA70F|nr:GntR family transcriptional regulator [Novosphingobium sp. BW1]TYC79393.1 GntR family transcriptional regulator [Novosphingobium sp. BW1]
MSPSHVFEPTYEAIRKRLISGTWPMGFRLEAGRLADDLGVSITPVRDSLNRLVGERLVDLVPGIGFHVPRLSERRLRDLLDLNLMLLLNAARIGAFPKSADAAEPPAHEHAVRTNALFVHIAFLSGNTELRHSIDLVSARLHVTRLHEIEVLPGAKQDLELIEIAWAGRRGSLSSALRHYHTVRKGAADRLIERGQAGTSI